GLAAAEQALEMAGDARIWEAEFRRARAEFLAALGGSRSEVEAELERALRVARSQGALALELRVAGSLLRQARKLGDDRSAGRARDLLAGIVARFPEAAETPDWREARSLLGRG